MRTAITEILVGLFLLASIIAFLMLAFKVSGLVWFSKYNSYEVSAYFENVGDLKERAPVTLAGVRIGEVSSIVLDSESMEAKVTMNINSDFNNITAANSQASIFTAGILGSNYIGITPGYENAFFDTEGEGQFLQEGSVIPETQSAIIIENLIGTLIFQMQNKDENKDE